MRSAILAPICALALVFGGCVRSRLPIFSEKDGVTDQQIAGTFRLKYRGNPFKTDDAILREMIPEQMEVVQKLNLYLVVHDGTLVAIARVHQVGGGIKIAQLWYISPKIPLYEYVIVKASQEGLQIRIIECPPNAPYDLCEPSSFAELTRLAAAANDNFYGKDGYLLFAERLNESK